MDMPKFGMYIIDLPRAVKKEHQREMWAALETVKGGYAYDDRFHFKYEWFDSPKIWVFTNQLPDLEYQSLDRWKLWTVVDNQLVKLNSQGEIFEPKIQAPDLPLNNDDRVMDALEEIISGAAL